MKINGKDLLVFLQDAGGAWRTVACSTQCELDVEREVAEVAGFASRRWREYVAGRAGWTVAVQSLLSVEGQSATDWLGMAESGSPVYLSFSTAAPGGEGGRGDTAQPDGQVEYRGYALMTRLTYTGQLGAMATFQAEFRGTGSLSERLLRGLLNETWIQNEETLLINDTGIYGEDF